MTTGSDVSAREIRAAVKARHPKPDRSDGRRRRPSRGAVLALVAALTLAAAGGGWWLRRVEDLAVARPDVGFTLPRMDPGQVSFLVAGLDLHHPGRDIEIVDVKALTSPNVEYLGAFTIWPRDHAHMRNKWEVSLGYPPPPPRMKDRHPAFDTVIPAAETAFPPANWGPGAPPPVTVAVGFRITSGDVAAVNGLRVIYKLDGKTRHEDFRRAVIACVKPHPCEAPDARGFDFYDSVLHRFGLVPEK